MPQRDLYAQLRNIETRPCTFRMIANQSLIFICVLHSTFHVKLRFNERRVEIEIQIAS